MNCLKNLERLTYSSEQVYKLTALYTYKGKDFHYESVCKNYMQGIITRTIEKDTYYASKLLNINISDSRRTAILKRNSEPKNNDERIFSNLKELFGIIQKKIKDMDLTANEYLSLANRVFKGVLKIEFSYELVDVRNGLFVEKKKVSKRNTLEDMVTILRNSIEVKKMEPTQVITNMYIDLLHSDIFNQKNEFIALLATYCLFFRQRFNMFKYVSFFEEYYNKLNEFKNKEISASYNWEAGFARTDMLNDAFIELMLNGYEHVQSLSDDYEFDRQLTKKDNVAAAIMKIPGTTFTKADVKKACPHLSDSTIQRALDTLKEQKKIAPNGTGRSATWTKVVTDEVLTSGSSQLTVFDFLGEAE